MNQIYNNDTIAAISSGLTKSGVGVIRISGPDSREIVEKIFTAKSGKPIELSEPSHIYYGFIHNVSRETSDEVLVLNMPAPHSFTGEDVVEVDCHGGILMMQRALEAIIDAGARNAEPGEFTKRAFLNGRMDLAQAEAVIDVINAGNDNAIRNSMSQLGGSLSEQIKALRETILEQAAYIEAALDDPEHYSLDGYSASLEQIADKLIVKIDKLVQGFDRGRHINNGIDTVIIGRPNAGKSSLMNAILGEDRAIVTQIPGTTRDTISEIVSLGNVMLRLTDTAGLRESKDEAERIGIDKALDNAKRAELILCVIDGSDAKKDDNDIRELIGFCASNKAARIYIINKTDIAESRNLEAIKALINEVDPDTDKSVVELSARTRDGLEQLDRVIERMFNLGNIAFSDDVIITSARHLELIKKAAESLRELKRTLLLGLTEDFYSIDLMNAYDYLGNIIGENTDEDLINEIFSKFCMGK